MMFHVFLDFLVKCRLQKIEYFVLSGLVPFIDIKINHGKSLHESANLVIIFTAESLQQRSECGKLIQG